MKQLIALVILTIVLTLIGRRVCSALTALQLANTASVEQQIQHASR